MPSQEWLRKPLYQVVAAVIVAVMGSTAIQVKFTNFRADPFTGRMAKELESRVAKQCEDLVISAEGRIASQSIDKVDLNNAQMKIWAIESFLPVGTEIPPPSVDNRLLRLESQTDRLESREQDLRDRIIGCCANNNRMSHNGKANNK